MGDAQMIYDATTSDVAEDETDAQPTAMHTTSPTTAVALTSVPREFNPAQLDLIKRTVAAGTSDDEFALFIEVCNLTGLNPFARQIYAIMRRQKVDDHWVDKMTIQTGIDGYLAIASRTGAFAGMDDVEYDTETGEHPTWARVTVYRLVQGQRMPFTATARWREYAQTNRDGNPIAMWARMAWTMLGKCARALALRLAFPAELGGVYTSEEMAQADNPAPQNVTQQSTQPRQSAAQPAQAQQAQQAQPQPSSARQRPPAPAQARTATPAAKGSAMTGPTAGTVNEWMTTDGCNPLGDAPLRKRMSALGAGSIADVETLLGRIRGSYNAYTRAAIEAELTEMEARTQAHDLRDAFPATAGGVN